MVTAPARAAALFGATVYPRVALPVPLAGAASVTQSSALVADHAHDWADAVTATVPVRPSAAAVTEVGEMEKVQGGGGAACEIVNV
jgi:hypothetical protein